MCVLEGLSVSCRMGGARSVGLVISGLTEYTHAEGERDIKVLIQWDPGHMAGP